MKSERVADNVYYFQSDNYARVNAGAIVGPDFAIQVDTLAYPDESLEIRDFIEQELAVPVRFVINTHYHADHSWGNCFFPGAVILGHELCRQMLVDRGTPSLAQAKKEGSTFRKVSIRPPEVTYQQGRISLKIGKKTVSLLHLPGHSLDNTAVLIEEDRVMFSGDTFMPLPYIVDGDIEEMIASMKMVSKMAMENIVQGHGDIILRGEVERTVKGNLAYLSAIRSAVRKAGRRKYPLDLLRNVDVESCGKGRVLLGGLAEELHQRNLRALYHYFYGEAPRGSEEDWEEV